MSTTRPTPERTMEPSTSPGPAGPSRSRRHWARAIRVLVASAILAAVGYGLSIGSIDTQVLRQYWDGMGFGPAWVEPSPGTLPEFPSSEIEPPWDGFITLDERQRNALGLTTTEVRAQTDPILLELLGTTDYDATTLSRIRPLFKCRIETVHVNEGQKVQKGEPLIELYSIDLAEAKASYEIEYIEWVYWKNLLDVRQELSETQAVSRQLLRETENEEMLQRREYEVARDKLLVYGLTESEIEAIESETGAEKAHMILRAPADGVVIERDVAPGNMYDENDTLLTIAPLDHLWVWGNVFEQDLDLVSLGQSWEIRFPYLNQTIEGRVEYVDNRVDPETRAVRVRTSIPNEGGRLKSNMLVQGMLEIEPEPGRVVVPRLAVVVDDHWYYVFVEHPNRPDAFERRTVQVVHEKEDRVVIADGLTPGDRVVTVGSVILAQLHDNQQIVQIGAPPNGAPSLD